MSQTPLGSSTPAAKKDDGSFIDSRKQLFQMILDGKSWSGRERNCCYLNTGGGRFANISAVSGFDFLDDARGLALTDWDHDGDLDLWITNRTAPRARVMRNDTRSGHHFLALRLQGVNTSNRDAIGARAELTVEDAGGERKLIKTVRAGEGFLAQSSKWLHFGLGDANRAVQLKVRWPDGQTEQFEGLDVDARYWIVQGTGTAEVWIPPARKVQLVASQPTLPAETLQAAIPLPEPLPLPLLEYALFDGELTTLTGPRDKPLLVNLWASWCMPCVRELAEFTQRSDDLRAAGLDVLALSVDGLSGDKTTTPEDARQMLAKLNFPFPAGVATIGMLDKLQIVHNQLFARHRPLPVPTSLLIDTQGRLAAIYKGPVVLERLLTDVAQLSLGRDERRLAALPYQGPWYGFPKIRLMRLVTEFFDRGYIEEWIQYTLQNKQQLAADPKFPWLLNRVGRRLAERGDMETAIIQFRDVLVRKGDIPEAHNNLALALRSQGKLTEAIESFRRAAELKPDDAKAHISLGGALMEAGKPGEALPAVLRALELNPDDATAHYLAGHILRSQGKTDEAIEHWSETIRLNPDHVEALVNLGDLRLQQRQAAEAAVHFRRALELNPNLLNTANNLAWILATNPDATLRDGAEAVRWAKHSAKLTEPADAGVLDTLAAAYAEAGRWDDAVATARQAIDLATAAGQTSLTEELEAHLRLYEQQKPFRDQPVQ